MGDKRRSCYHRKPYRTAPILADLHTWLIETQAKLSAKSPMALAIGYSLSHWRALTRFVDDGLMEAHNNIAERSLRGVAIGRKNYLFCGDDDAAQRAAVVYSLLATCKAHGVNERAWLEDVLRRIPEYEQAEQDYAELHHANWRALSEKLFLDGLISVWQVGND